MATPSSRAAANATRCADAQTDHRAALVRYARGTMSEGNPKNPAAAPRPKPPVPTGAKPTPPPLQEGNPFLPADSWSKVSSSKIDAAWEAPDDEPRAPASAKAPPTEPEPAPVAASPEKAEPTPAPPPVEKRSRGKALALGCVILAVLGGAGFAYQSQVAAPSAKTEAAPPETAQTAAEPVATTEPAPPPTFTAEPPPPSASVAPKPATTAAAVNIDPASRAFLDATQLPPGRKIVVDGRVVGTSPRKVAIRCGTHRIQIGDQAPESVDFPCGGEVNFTE